MMDWTDAKECDEITLDLLPALLEEEVPTHLVLDIFEKFMSYEEQDPWSFKSRTFVRQHDGSKGFHFRPWQQDLLASVSDNQTALIALFRLADYWGYAKLRDCILAWLAMNQQQQHTDQFITQSSREEVFQCWEDLLFSES